MSPSNVLRFLGAAFISIMSAKVCAQPQIPMMQVLFEETEPGIEPYASRLLLNETYLRLDDGNDSSDFILFNRKTGQIHSFNHEDETHMVIDPVQAAEIEFELDFKISSRSLPDAPKINGVTPVEYQFIADGNLCKQSVNISGLMPQVSAAMISYEQALVEQSKSTLPRIPSSMRSACYMANNFLHVSEYIRVGFPLHVVDNEGRQKRLVSFQQVQKPRSIVQFPQGYRIYNPDSNVKAE